MKKKILLTVSVVIAITVLTAVLVGCTSLPAQKALNSLWDASETAVYDVIRYSADTVNLPESERKILSRGEMTITTKRVNSDSITVGNETIDNFTGTLVVTEERFEDGAYLNSAVAFTSKFVPVASYKDVFIKGYPNESVTKDTRQTINAKYSGNKYVYSLSENVDDIESSTNGEIPLNAWDKSPYLDTLMIYHIGRASFSGKNNAFNPITMTMPLTANGSLKTTGVSFSLVSNDVKIKANGVEEMACAKVQITKAAVPPVGKGLPNYVYYNNEPLSLGDGHAATAGTRVIVRIEERSIVCTLKSFTSSAAA